VVKFALSDPAGRVAMEPPKHQASHIRSIRFDVGILDGQVLHLSSELNTLLGSGQGQIIHPGGSALRPGHSTGREGAGYQVQR